MESLNTKEKENSQERSLKEEEEKQKGTDKKTINHGE
jgi:hypothetical protein